MMNIDKYSHSKALTNLSMILEHKNGCSRNLLKNDDKDI